MSLTKKSDVKNHLSPRHRREIHLYRPESQPDPTGVSRVEQDKIETVPSDSTERFAEEHSSSDVPLEPADQLTRSVSSQRPKVSETART
ncbi:MAG TPA: hypothetical protein VHD85_02855 [Terracidiphilus sp.]|nr:hypothetical protein [Terracidiphilus sp.]